MKISKQIAAAFTLFVVTESSTSAEKSGTSFLRHRMLPPDCSTVQCAVGCLIENPCATDETCVPCNDSYVGCTAQCTVANLDCGGYYKCEAATTEPTTTTTTTTVNAGVEEGGCLTMGTVCGGNTGNDCSGCCSNSFINTQGKKTCAGTTTTTVATAAADNGGTSSPTSSPSAGPTGACQVECDEPGYVCDRTVGLCKLDQGESCTMCPTLVTQCLSGLSCVPTNDGKNGNCDTIQATCELVR